MNRVQVVPLARSVDRVYASEAVVTLRNRRSKAMADQLTTASKKRLTKRIGRLAAHDMHAVDEVIRVQLGLDQVFRPA